MLVECDRQGKGRDTTSTLRWQHEGKEYSLFFPFNVSYVYSDPLKKIYLSIYQQKKIYSYNLDSTKDSEFFIPEKESYQFRGLNKNEHSTTSVTMLYMPMSDSVGNQWGDIEQYELLREPPILGDMIDIWR